MQNTILQLEGVSSFYGNIQILHEISFSVYEAEILTIIGSNGAGKTTLLKSISGLISMRRGIMQFLGQDICKMPSDKIVALGISQVPEGRQLFGTFSVWQNLYLGSFSRYKKIPRNELERTYSFIYDLFPILEKRKKQLAMTLSGGEQQMLAIGRALVANPKLLLMDEPSMGLAPLIVKEIFSLLKTLVENGLTVMLVEQNAVVALDVAKRGFVLDMGRISIEGTSDFLKGNEMVRKIYMGEE